VGEVLKLAPTRKPTLPGDDELDSLQGHPGRVAEVGLDAVKGGGVAGLNGLEQFFGVLSE